MIHTHLPADVVATIGDPDGTRTVTSIIALLVAIGLALLLLAVWVHRTTRPDPELLAPLEVMGERSWRRADPVWQRRRLDELRPSGARPLDPSVAPPELDEAFDAGPSAGGFDDLRSGSGQVDRDETVAIDADAAASAADAVPADATPVGVSGPSFDELDDTEFDESALSAAREQLERELAASNDQRQLDLFEADRDG